MRLVSKMVLAALAFGASASAASAAVSFTDTSAGNQLNAPTGQSIILNFNGGPTPLGWSFSGDLFTGTVSNNHAAPFDGFTSAPDPTQYAAAEPGQNFTINMPMGLKGVSIFFGSVDNYNHVTFNGPSFTQTLDGSTLNAVANGDQTSNATNLRYYFSFQAADKVDQIVFSTDFPAFEFDNVAIASVPEPATWMMLILGFGFVGFMMRSNRQRVSLATA